jgi:HAE1 family hydrophobic/amphiphilic exporter-1
MLLSNISIKRPVFASVLMLILVTLGVFSYRKLAIDLMPDVEIPVLSVLAVYPGASPEAVEREVSRKIEEAVNPIAGVRHVTSISREGLSTIIVEFELEVKLNDAAQEARAKISAIRNELPQGMEEPVIQKLDIHGFPVVSLAIRSATMPTRELTTLVDRRIKRRLENISGVGKVKIVGGSTREVNVNIDPVRLEAIGMGVNELVSGLAGENVNTPLGRIDRGTSEMPLRVSGRPDKVSEFPSMVISQRNGAPVRLGEVADVVDGIEEQRSAALVNGIPAVALEVFKQSKVNTVMVADEVKAEIEKLKKELPPGVEIDLVQDTSVFIRESLADVQTTILLGGLLTILIVFCFLNSWRSTVITGLTLPISVISSFIAMYFFGMTINVMTLMALSLAIGLLIDDAIVVRENIVRHLEKGQDHFTAAREGTSEIGLAVMATSFSIMAVFIPVAFMKGIVGRFFFQFGLTVAFAVLVSLFVSFTLDPMLSSRWYDPDIERKGKRHLVARILDVFNAWFERTADRYKAAVGWALDHRKWTFVIAGAAFIAGAGVFFQLQSEFFPVFDHEELAVRFKTAPDASFQETYGRMEKVLQVLGQYPEIAHTYGTIGAGDSDTVRDASIYVKLKPKSERRRTQQELMPDIREKLMKVPGLILSVEEDPGNFQKPLQVLVRGPEIPKLKEYARTLKKGAYGIRGIKDIDVSLELDLPEYRMLVDREKTQSLGLSTPHMVSTVGALVGGQVVSSYEDEEGEALDVRVRLPLDLREDISQVGNLKLAVYGEEGKSDLVPISDLVRFQRTGTPVEIDRMDLARQVVLSANLDGTPLGTASQKIMEEAAKIPMDPGYNIRMAGDTEIMVESFGYMAEALLLAVIFVYLILAAQFESFIDPFAIMLSLPLSVVGMAGMLLLTGDTVNIMSLIGLILLMGLVTKNAILLVDYAKVLRSRGMPRREAVILAGRTRLRPIMMTTLAMIFGMLPLALAIGQGAEMRAPMARAVIGGLVTSTMLTLLVVPVVYTFLDDFAVWLKKRWTGARKEEVA